MTNAELIKALRHCGTSGGLTERCWTCDYYDREPWCEAALVNDAADALEAAEKRIAELSLDCELFQQKCMELGAQKVGDEKARTTEIRDKLLASICDLCDTTAEERLKDELCENCPLTSLIREAFDEND